MTKSVGPLYYPLPIYYLKVAIHNFNQKTILCILSKINQNRAIFTYSFFPTIKKLNKLIFELN